MRTKSEREEGLEGLLPPRTELAERGVLGCILKNPDLFPEIAMRLNVSDFFGAKCHLIFGAMVDVFEATGAVVAESVGQKLIEKNQFEEAGGSWFFEELSDDVCYWQNYRHWVNEVRRVALLRSGMQLSVEMAGAFTRGSNPGKLIAEFGQRVSRLQEVAGGVS